MTPTLTSLVDTQRFRQSVVRRLFTNKLPEAIGELLQNAQRAGAKNIYITTHETGFRFQDDGHGLRDTTAFHTLLQIAATHYDDPTVESNQDPMGVGVHAMLAHTSIKSITFCSGILRLTIDTHQWWTDEVYASTWAERMEYHPESVQGLSIKVTCTSELVCELRLLFNKHQNYYYTPQIWIDEKKIIPLLPQWAQLDHVLVRTKFEGNTLIIGYKSRIGIWGGGLSCINWYGQLIKTSLNAGGLCFYLHVTSGRPVNPVAPTRVSLIQDEALNILYRFIGQELSNYLFDPLNEAFIQPSWVHDYYLFAPSDAEQVSPYFVARKWPNGMKVESVDDMGPEENLILLRYTDQPRIINSEIMIQHGSDNKGQVYRYGIPSFIPMIGTSYECLCGNRDRLTIQTIWWNPGDRRADSFNEPGIWGLSTNANPPEIWSEVTRAPVYGFNDADCWEVGAVDFMVGCTDPLAFYRHEAWAGFDQHHEDHSYDEICESYDESRMVYIRQLMGNCISPDCNLFDIQRHMENKSSRIISIHYHYTDGYILPSAITARNEVGQEKKLSLVGRE